MKCKTFDRYDKDLNPIYRNKVTYDTQDEAIEVAKHMNSRDHAIHKVVPYYCDECHKYHLGKNGKILKEKDKIKNKNYIKEKRGKIMYG